ncbi:RHS repeat domain-containing protein [Maridesulfovibrio sp.]|uniref:RHS repeat domain-containing protein n=1 Tax=Maridesulfovibrio sp. TaxID=2795000 RepID=UPI003BA925AA
MSIRNDFKLRPKKRDDLSLALRMYGENESPEMQIENLWEIYSPSTGMGLVEPCPDFSEFSRGDRMYPSMMKPEVKARWEQKNKEWKIEKERYAWRKRLAQMRFIRENPDLPLAQDLALTEYGKALIEEFSSKQPQTGTGENLYDEFERDSVEFDPEDPIRVTPFVIPGAEEPFSVLATGRDGDGRIVEKLCSLEPKDHHVQYEYDAGGRLCAVWKEERLIEEYKYGKQGERYFGSTPQTGQHRFTYGPGLRLERSGEVKYSYDGEGRLVMKQDGLEVTTYEYHHSGQLEQVNLPDGRRVSYTIDPEGKRTSKSVNGKTVEEYLWHSFTTLAVISDEHGNRTDFAYDEEGDPVVMRCNDEVYFLASDQVGTIYMVANKEGHEVKRIIRDSFGNLIVDTNEHMNIPVGFAGGLYDRDTGLVHFGFREYDPSSGRFITPDPLGLEGGDVDVYGYCHDDPVNFVDRGRSKKDSEKKEVKFMDDLR